MTKSDFYRRNLPHWQPAHAEYFVTFRLKNSLPKSVVYEIIELNRRVEKQLQNTSTEEEGYLRRHYQRKIFEKYEENLDAGAFGPTWLAKPEVAALIEEALLHRDKNEYDLYAFCIMSNHVHVVFRLLENIDVKYPVTEIFKKLKSYTASKANKILNRKGPFWQSESYDRLIRDQEELENTIRYVLNNPVKAGLIDFWKDWEFSYCRPEFVKSLA